MDKLVSKDDIARIARLAQLEIVEEDLDHFATELNQMLEYVNQLSKIDTSGIEPTTYAVKMENVMREDILEDSTPLEDIVDGAPSWERGHYKVPRVISSQ